MVARRHVPRALKKQAVGEFHDIGFMHRRDFLAPVGARVVEGEAGNSRGRLLSDDFQAFHHPRYDFMFDTRIKPLGIFAHDDEIDVFIARLDARKILDGPEVSVKVEALAQFDINAREALPHRSRHRSFEGNLVALKGVHEFLRNRRPMFF